mgnify:CR=1 FL=1
MNLISILIFSFVIISILGTVLHFTHGWFKKGILLHIFSAINESTWEHMKLLVFPTLLVMVFQFVSIKDLYNNLWNSLLVLFLVQVLTIPLLFEPLRFLIKKVPLLINILIFYFSIFLGLLFEYYFLSKEIFIFNEYLCIFFIVLLLILFFIFTYYPPKFFLFKDPVTKRYGDIK